MRYFILFYFFVFSQLLYAGCEDGDCHNGYGTYIWFNGDTDDRSWSHGDKYTGYFLNGKMHGQGVYYYINGDVYIGNYLNGKQSGYGVITYSFGEKFSGYFMNNLKHGKGVITTTKGKEIDVEFDNGNLLKK